MPNIHYFKIYNLINQPVISIDTKYRDLFKIILNDTITSINEYSTIITDFTYIMEDDGIQDDGN